MSIAPTPSFNTLSPPLLTISPPNEEDSMVQRVQRLWEHSGSMTREELELLDRWQSPRLKETLSSWGKIRADTDLMSLQIESLFPKEEIQVEGESFTVYDISQSHYGFIVHAAPFQDFDVKATLAQRMRSGFLCTSYLSHKTPDFFRHVSHYGMVLSIDPAAIVKTSSEDSFSPFKATDPNTVEYYRLQRKLMVLTGYIDQLYVERISPTNDFQRYLHLRALQEDGYSVDQKELACLEQGTGIAKDEVLSYYDKKGMTHWQLEVLLRKNPEDQELLELKRILDTIITNIAKNNNNHVHLHCIQKPEELTAQTPFQSSLQDNVYGLVCYNEIDLHLPGALERKDWVSLKAILINEFIDEVFKRASSPLLRCAKRNQIPILIRKGVRAQRSVAEKIKKAILSLGDVNKLEFQRIFSLSSDISPSEIQDLLLLTAEKGRLSIAQAIYNAKPELFDPVKVENLLEICLDNLDKMEAPAIGFGMIRWLIQLAPQLLNKMRSLQLRPGFAFAARYLILKEKGDKFDPQTLKRALPYLSCLAGNLLFMDEFQAVRLSLKEEDIETIIRHTPIVSFEKYRIEYPLMEMTQEKKKMGSLLFLNIVKNITIFSKEDQKFLFEDLARKLLFLYPQITAESLREAANSFAVSPEIEKLSLQIFGDLKNSFLEGRTYFLNIQKKAPPREKGQNWNPLSGRA